MSNPSKNKGDRAELEVQAILRDLLGLPVRRALGAGRKEDVGDIFGIPDTIVQVANYKDIALAIRLKLPQSEQQRLRANAQFAATFIRQPGGKYFVAQSPPQWADMWRETR